MPLSRANVSRIPFWAVNVLLSASFILEIFAHRAAALVDAVDVSLAAMASVMALARQLPLQNVLLGALIAGFVGGTAHGLSSDSNLSVPFGPIHFNPAAGGQLFQFVPWTVPLIWIIAIFNARGMARLILRPWRKVKNYGFWLIGVTVMLAVAFDVALEPFAWYARHFTFWHRTRITVTWQGTPLLNFVGWAFISSIILVLATPTLIPKQPKNHSAPDLHPLALWLATLILFAVGCARAGLSGAVVADAAIALATAAFAIRGAKW